MGPKGSSEEVRFVETIEKAYDPEHELRTTSERKERRTLRGIFRE